MNDKGIDLLGNKILDIGDLFLLIETGVKQDKFSDAEVFFCRALRFMRNLHSPGIGIDARVTHADINICEAQINILTIFHITESLLIYRVQLGKEVTAIAVFVRIKKRQP